MRIYAIETGKVAVKTRQRAGKGKGTRRFVNTLLDGEWTEPLPIYAFVIEHPEAIIVVDTGETARASEPGYFPRWHPYFRFGMKAWVEPEQEIGPQLRRLGIAPGDVGRVVLTHLHTDHAGGLRHFPESEILVSQTEHELASGFAGRVRGYLPNRWPQWFAPTLVEFGDRPVGPFPRSAPLTAAGDVHLVPTPGHSGGQMALILQTAEVDYFFAGDTSYSQALLLRQTIDGIAPDEAAACRSLALTLEYVTTRPTVYLPSHDPESAARLAARRTAVAATAAMPPVLV